MTLTMDIALLQKHDVCQSGQVNFRRAFSRSHTWTSLTAMEEAFASRHEKWSWSEAVEKFEIDGDAHSELFDSLRRDENHEDEDDDALRARAWCRLYWAKMHPQGITASKVPAAAKDYIKAVESLEQTIKFKAQVTPNLRITCDIDGYFKGNEGPTQTFINRSIAQAIPRYIEETIAELTTLVAAKKQILEDCILAEKNPPAVAAEDTPAPAVLAVA